MVYPNSKIGREQDLFLYFHLDTSNIYDCIHCTLHLYSHSPKAAVQSLVSRLKDSNPNVVLLALQVFESVVKNCGQSVHEQVACRAVMEQIHDVLRTNPNDDVRKKILLLLSTWVYAFRNEPKYRAVQVRGRNTWRNGHNNNNNSGNDSLFHQL
ncbi:Hepatocyte growth factor-regulated tyrosine kinase substrate [Portunus trituberculatus]|uniref:Hepatocyte growth factor-regulated tyrosine kinase substrate n=1 Tax=Portunus trituberculatus TaxID=210409 RepID=A0A5B7K906_PORTR|nr:Hepatocyte growth factor-regulated tyrosine kinase substrate [Portunus trituberculatus]